MNSKRDNAASNDFTIRVIPLLRAAMVRRDADAHARGWFFEAVAPDQTGYCILGRADVPSIRLSLINGGLVRVSAVPGQAMVVELAAFDAALAETLVSAWWAAVVP